MFTEHIDPKDDRIHSLKDDEWNQKILEFYLKVGLRMLANFQEHSATDTCQKW